MITFVAMHDFQRIQICLTSIDKDSMLVFDQPTIYIKMQKSRLIQLGLLEAKHTVKTVHIMKYYVQLRVSSFLLLLMYVSYQSCLLYF